MSTDPTSQFSSERLPEPPSPRGNFFAVLLIFLILLLLIGGLIGVGVYFIREGLKRTQERQSTSQSEDGKPDNVKTGPALNRESTRLSEIRKTGRLLPLRERRETKELVSREVGSGRNPLPWRSLS